MADLEQGDLVLCSVEKISGTTVFVKVNDKKEGRIVLSEIAPGRIRNLRDYVVPKKTIVCKVLRISGENIELSLRRVSLKEKKQVLEIHKLEKSYKNIFKTILNENAQKIIEKIKEKEDFKEFIEKIKENPKELEALIGKEDTKRILEILNSQKSKKSILKKELIFHTTEPRGLELIKKFLIEIKDAEIKYISAGRYSIKIESSDLKKADNEIKEIILNLEKQMKNHNFELKYS